MNVLAIELSTAQGSLALFVDEQLITERTWNEKAYRSQHIFHMLPEMLKDVSLLPSDIDTYIIGRGPGNYSGLRIGITTARSMALPGQKKVFALSSGEALAAETAEREGVSTVAVIGDARREMLWLGVYRLRGMMMETQMPWTVIRKDMITRHLSGSCTVITSDWERLAPLLKEMNTSELSVIEEPRYPSAKYVGKTGLLKIGAGEPSEPLIPIYSHPPVAQKMDEKGLKKPLPLSTDQ